MHIPAGSNASGGVTTFGAGNTGRYWVSVANDTAPGETPAVDHNQTLIVTSTGIGRNGATSTVQATFTVAMVNEPAIVVNGRAVIVGVPTILGANGIIHTNDTMTILGITCTEQYAASSANIVVLFPDLLHHGGGSCGGPGVRHTLAPPITVPVHDIPGEFKDRATYVLGATGERAGKVFDKAGTQIGSSPWTNAGGTWTWDGLLKTWTMAGSANPSGIYYSDGNIILAGITASFPAPAKATIVAEGFISVIGVTNLTPAMDNYSLVAGTDLLIAGVLGTPGLYYARDQFDIIGITSVNGAIRVANQSDGASPGGLNPVLRVLGALNITGIFTLRNNGFASSEGIVTGWHEVRH